MDVDSFIGDYNIPIFNTTIFLIIEKFRKAKKNVIKYQLMKQKVYPGQ